MESTTHNGKAKVESATQHNDLIIDYRVEAELNDGSLHTITAPSSQGPEGAEHEAEQIALELLNGRTIKRVVSLEEVV